MLLKAYLTAFSGQWMPAPGRISAARTATPTALLAFDDECKYLMEMKFCQVLFSPSLILSRHIVQGMRCNLAQVAASVT
jgi:hypothetical protein